MAKRARPARAALLLPRTPAGHVAAMPVAAADGHPHDDEHPVLFRGYLACGCRHLSAGVADQSQQRRMFNPNPSGTGVEKHSTQDVSPYVVPSAFRSRKVSRERGDGNLPSVRHAHDLGNDLVVAAEND